MTLCFLLVAQLQFLATLSLVKYTVAVEGSLLADFVSGLRCVCGSPSLVRSFVMSCTNKRRKLQKKTLARYAR